MTRDDIIRMAREAGCLGPGKGGDPYGLWEPDGEENVTELMFRFAALVAAAEREACAKVCEKEMEPYSGFDKESYAGGAALTAAAVSIRARGQS